MKELDPLLHNQLRLAIMALLVANEKAAFTYLVEKTGATRGNLSVQVSNLEQAGYIHVEKSFKGKKPLTTCKISQKGLLAMDIYTKALQEYLKF